MVEIIECHGVRVPFHADVIPPNIERPLRRGRYAGGECRIIANVVGKRDRFLELGTGLGVVTAKAALAGAAQVATFEANPALLPAISDILQQNGVEDAIEVFNGAVTRGAPTKTVPFYQRPDLWTSSLSPDPATWTETVEVPTFDLDVILEQMKPTVIRARLQGRELDLLVGADLSSAKFVTVEIDNSTYGAAGVKRLFDAMSDMGFGYSPRFSSGGAVVTFESAGRKRSYPATEFSAPSKAAPKPKKTKKPKVGAPKVLVPTCMKNEGPYILEWLAYHRAMGVTDFLIFTNDCDDGTVEILNHMEDLGLLTHLPNPAPVFESPNFQPSALKYTQMSRQYAEADYVISMDVDEYLNIQVGDGTISALLNHVGDFDVISLCEQLFGSDGHERYEPGFVTEQFTRCGSMTPGNRKARRGVKSILRRDCGLTLKNHRPHPGEDVSFDDVLWLDGSGNRAPVSFVHELQNGMDCRGRFELAWLNHYPLRSLDSFLLKRDRGDVVVKNRKVS
ncbi:MAG: glycosyltransferase family 2 protein, partial [Pikeienuella sp.]